MKVRYSTKFQIRFNFKNEEMCNCSAINQYLARHYFISARGIL